MHPALLKLLWLRVVAWARRFATRGRLLRRIVGGIFVAYLLVSWVLSAVAVAFVERRTHADPAVVLQVGPVVLGLLITVRLAAVFTSNALQFSPAEMDFLFPAPFTRRQLLLYKLGLGNLGGLFLSLILSAQVMHLGASWLSTFLALMLAFTFMQLAGVLAALGRQRLGKGLYGRATLALGALILVAALLAVLPTIRRAGMTDPGGLLRTIAARSHDWPAARAVLSPFEVFIRVLVAPPGPGLLAWTGVALAMLGALLLGIFKLDSVYAEAAVAASARTAAKIDRARRSGSGLVARSAGVQVPRLPHLAGVGPIAWRQFVTAARSWPSLVVVFVVLAALLVGARWIWSGEETGRAGMIGMAFPLYIAFTSLLRFDFRGDIEHIDTLKSLPLRPSVIAAGQLATPALIVACTVVLIGLFATFGFPAPGRGAWVLGASLLCALPLGLMIASMENIIFLHYPTRVAGAAASDSNSLLRHAGVGLLKVLILAVGGGILAGLTGAAWFASRSTALSFAVFWLTSCLLSAAGLHLVARAFRKFDPSRDMPT